jgi:hypothetical protein
MHVGSSSVQGELTAYAGLYGKQVREGIQLLALLEAGVGIATHQRSISYDIFDNDFDIEPDISPKLVAFGMQKEDSTTRR